MNYLVTVWITEVHCVLYTYTTDPNCSKLDVCSYVAKDLLVVVSFSKILYSCPL